MMWSYCSNNCTSQIVGTSVASRMFSLTWRAMTGVEPGDVIGADGCARVDCLPLAITLHLQLEAADNRNSDSAQGEKSRRVPAGVVTRGAGKTRGASAPSPARLASVRSGGDQNSAQIASSATNGSSRGSLFVVTAFMRSSAEQA